ncbi:hypothetical protein EMCRGX_G007479 [Ephydatia muelleri]
MPKEKKVKGREKLIHPNSRKALQLFKKAHRDEKLDKKKAERSISNANEVMKLMWFKEHLDASKKFYTHSEMVEFVESYLGRLDAELEKLLGIQEEKSSVADHYRQQYASREDAIRTAMVRERQLFESSGIEAPDLTTPKFMKEFMEWNGEENLLPRLHYRRFKSKKTEPALV